MIGPTTCPGCGVELPASSLTPNPGRNASPECWQLYGEVQGFELTAAFARQLQALELPPVQGGPLPRLLAISGGRTPLESIRRALGVEGGGAIAVEEVASQPAWLEDADTGAGAIPVKVMQRIVQWTAARHG